MAQDEDENKENFVAPTEETANNDKTLTVSHDDLDEEGFKVDTNSKPINETIIIKEVVEENLPKAQVILPIRRRDTSQAVLNVAPCGGILKRKADTLTNKGSSVHVIWETITPVGNANCTVKLSPGLDQETTFTTLKPYDVKLDKNGHFPCGQVKGFEAHQFELPNDYVCDQCTLQWTWITPKGSFYSCSDIIINGNKIEDCIAKCTNGGACFNGKCLCVDDYYGEFCQLNSKIFLNFFVFF
jgi:hypothetical protein